MSSLVRRSLVQPSYRAVVDGVVVVELFVSLARFLGGLCVGV